MFGEGLSGYFTSSRRIYLPFTVIFPFLTNYEIAAPLIPKALRRSFSIFPGSSLGTTMKLVIFYPLD